MARPKSFKREFVLFWKFSQIEPLKSATHSSCRPITHTQLETHHALRSSQPLQSCPRSHARPARLHKPPMQSLREVPPWHVWCGGLDLRKRDAPRLPHMFELPRPRDFRRGHCCGYKYSNNTWNTTYRVHPRAKIASHDTMISFQHPDTPGIRNLRRGHCSPTNKLSSV